MALLLSTLDGNQITGDQARALHYSFGDSEDFVIRNFGSMLATTVSGFNFTIGTGGAVLNGTLVENTTPLTKTFPQPSSSGTGMVVVKVNLSTGIPSIELKSGTSLIQNNLVSNVTGTREYEIYRFNYTTSGITSLVDKRKLNKKYTLSDISHFYFDAQVLTTDKILTLSKSLGDVTVSGSNITLDVGFLHKIELDIGFKYSGWTYCAVTNTAGTIIPDSSRARLFAITPDKTDVFSPKPSLTTFIDLRNSTTDQVIQIRSITVNSSPELMTHASMIIEKYLVK